MTIDDVIKKIEGAGLYWAIEGGPDGLYIAVVEKSNYYIGDGLSGPVASAGETAVEALSKALDYELTQAPARTVI
jgi:hypothetical protein